MGIPPFASFLAELMVISAGISAYLLSAITVLVPVITGGYFLWMLKRVIVDPAPTAQNSGAPKGDISLSDAGVLVLYLIPLIILTAFSFLVLSPAAPVAQWTANLARGGFAG